MRWTLKPQLVCPGAKLSVWNGISNSALQPVAVLAVFTFQIPFQSRLSTSPSSPTSSSTRAPTELVWNLNALRRSANVSNSSETRSSASSTASRLKRVVTIASGSVSWQVTPTYSVVGVYRTRTCVACEAGAPSSGSRCRKSSATGAVCHAGSSSRPSRTIGCRRGTARSAARPGVTRSPSSSIGRSVGTSRASASPVCGNAGAAQARTDRPTSRAKTAGRTRLVSRLP